MYSVFDSQCDVVSSVREIVSTRVRTFSRACNPTTKPEFREIYMIQGKILLNLMVFRACFDVAYGVLNLCKISLDIDQFIHLETFSNTFDLKFRINF